MKRNIDFGKIKNNNLYIFLEICLFISNIIKLVLDNRLSYILLIILILCVVCHIQYIIRKKKGGNEIPEGLKFMVEFAKSIGYTNSTKINTFKEHNCSVDSIEKIYDIDGINVKVQKEYIGRVIANTCDSIKIMTCGGSSATLDDIGINIYIYDFEKKKYIKTKFDSITENERTKLIKVCFNKILSNKDKFKVKYQENHWYGAMRNKKDGIVVGEHLFFDSLSEQIITLRFFNINSINAELYQYDFKENKITKMETHICIDNNICKASIKNTSSNCVYFLMYNYD